MFHLLLFLGLSCFWAHAQPPPPHTHTRRRAWRPMLQTHPNRRRFSDVPLRCFRSGTGSLASRVARTKRRMAETIFFADGLLAHPQNLAGVLRLRIAGMRVHSDRYMVPTSTDENNAVHPSVQVLSQYQLLLGTDSNTVKDGGVPSFREAGDPTSGQVCLNHLFTHQDFQSVLGVAYEVRRHGCCV